MRLVIQRVNTASVGVNNKTVGKIEKGLFALIGIKRGDSRIDADFLADKLLKLRVMADENDKMNLSVKDVNGSVLAVSQFTLHADTKDGNRPSFLEAEDPGKAVKLYSHFINKLKESGLTVKTGEFGEYMKIEALLDGPVTIILES